ncbi:murein biosynthesis integral membrane protein MurJ [Solicola gregarius]|uniref:MATE family efflux transporter n=1 Tax=Solicola gregarius TaxID=2908642 RepID=A0AA46TLN1_9ACTN|nr:lipid II flippase MurJ [Solicola gregarius]UYM07561.1 MATE family efflux transporter [Solicola gregarius]
MTARSERRWPAGWRGTVLGAAALITVLTVLARVAGFARNWVFAHTVGQTELNGVYMTVNTVPNILYEIVAGGALASLVVPLLAHAVAKNDREQVDRTASALLTWTIVVLTPLALAIAVLAEPIARFMLRDGAGVDVGASMLRVFAPQIVLYGIGVVLTGILQAHKRFGGPAVAPLLSSLVVIAAYVTYAVAAPRGTDLDTVTTGQQLILSVGTTLGVVALSLSLIVPLGRLRLRLRPSLRFPSGVGRSVRALAYAGVAALVAQQASVVVALLLGNAVSPVTTAVFVQAQTIYLLPWAVLAVPVATTVFPRLTESWASGDRTTYRAQLSASTCMIIVLACGSAAASIAAARPLARVMVQGVPGTNSVDELTAGIVGFAPGLLGYGLFALLSRALYATHETTSTAIACVVGWFTVIAADVVIASAFEESDRVLALAIGNSVGMTVLGAGLLWAVVRRAGAHALAGAPRVVAVSVTAGLAAAAVGWWFERLIDGGNAWAAVVQGLASALVAAAVFGALATAAIRAPIVSAVSALRGGATAETGDSDAETN